MSFDTKPSSPIGIAGSGRVAQALGRLLRELGEPVTCLASRDLQRAAKAAEFIGANVEAVSYADLPGGAGRLLIAVPDAALPDVIGKLAVSAKQRGGIALHTSGARDLEDFQPLLAAGFSCGTLHPLQTISSAQQGCAALPGATFAVSGGGEALDWARSIARLLQGRAVTIPAGHRPLYHAAAVMASNYSIALLDAASEVMALATDTSRDDALSMLAPLTRTAVENAFARGPVASLTGPIERGDASTVALHIAALASAPSRIRSLYIAAGLQTLDLARSKGLSQTAANGVQAVLEQSA